MCTEHNALFNGQYRVTIRTYRVPNDKFARFSYFFPRSLNLDTGQVLMALHFFAHFAHFLEILTIMRIGRDSSVEIVTRYGLEGPRIKSWHGRDFPPPSKQALRPNPGSCRYNGYQVVFAGVKRPDRGADHPPHL